MTDKSVFSDAEWHALTDAPLLVTLAIFVTGEHGPISMVKEATASARAIARPGDRGSAGGLIPEIATPAGTKGARPDMKEHQTASADGTLRPAPTEPQPAATPPPKMP